MCFPYEESYRGNIVKRNIIMKTPIRQRNNNIETKIRGGKYLQYIFIATSYTYNIIKLESAQQRNN